MSEASNKVLIQQTESGNITSAKAEILNFIIDRDGSNLMHIASLLFYKESTVAARLSELEDDGLIYIAGKLDNGTHSFWKYEPNPQKRKERARERLRLKYELWKKRGEKFKEFINPELF